jgi:hypothetical protein
MAKCVQTTNSSDSSLFNGIPALRGIILDRVLQAARRVLNPDTAPWTPPPPALLTYIPQLRKMAPPVMQPFISAHPGQILPQGMPGQFDMDDFGFEADRPQTADG